MADRFYRWHCTKSSDCQVRVGLFVKGRYHTACRYSGPMVWNSASVTFLKICYYGRQWDLIWCNDTYNHSFLLILWHVTVESCGVRYNRWPDSPRDQVRYTGVITPNQIPLTTIVTYLQKSYRSRISNHWATIPACSVVPPIYKKSKKTYCHVSF